MATIEERLRRGCRWEGDCWIWQLSCRQADGYGQMRVGSKSFPTHRLAFQAFNGPIPPGMWVLHSCDNPPCCNPAHLRLGTRADNARDTAVRERCRTTVLTTAEVLRGRTMRAEGQSPKEIAALLGKPYYAVQQAIKGRTWRHLPMPTAEVR